MADTVDHLLTEAAQLRSAGRFDAAAASYRQAIAATPHAAPPLLLLGQLRLQQGNHAEAAELIGRALALDPQIAGGATAMGIAQSNLDQIDAAIASFTRAVALDPHDLQALTSLGILLSFDDRLAEAVPYYQRAIALSPDDPELHNGLGVALLGLQRRDEAVAALRRAVALASQAAEPHNNLGLALVQTGETAAAIDCFRRAVALQPGYVDAQLNLAQALHRSHDLDAALASYGELLSVAPDYAPAHFAKGMILAALKRPAEAVPCFEHALALRPDQPEAHLQLAVILLERGEADAALAHCNQAVALRPDLAAAHIGVGNVLRAQDKREAATESYRRALEIAPDHAVAHANLGLVLSERGRAAEAIAAYRQALKLAPDLAEAHHGLGRSLRDTGRYEAAIEHFDRVLELRPELADAYAVKGNALKEMGQLAAARQAIETAIALEPGKAQLYHDLAECIRFSEGDPHLAAMEALAARPDALSDDAQTALQFALGKAYADLGDTERSFDALLSANALKRRQIEYDEATVLAVLEHVQTVFTPTLLRARQGVGHPSRVPIFIVGMPRSGSTLVEQILASHPDVHGAGELGAFHDALGGLAGPDSTPVAYPAQVTALTDQQLWQLGERYLASLSEGAPAVPRITDKTLGNFRFLGLIHLALPNARIIHTRRNPVDTCLSCFSKLFTGQLSFTYELGELGRYYRAYARLMTHWRQVLPPDVMLEVDYESVVGDLEGAARRILTHCDLAWDARCLRFHVTDRPVRTASVLQVRQPLYSHAVGRAQPYALRLQPLLEALGIGAQS